MQRLANLKQKRSNLIRTTYRSVLFLSVVLGLISCVLIIHLILTFIEDDYNPLGEGTNLYSALGLLSLIFILRWIRKVYLNNYNTSKEQLTKSLHEGGLSKLGMSSFEVIDMEDVLSSYIGSTSSGSSSSSDDWLDFDLDLD